MIFSSAVLRCRKPSGEPVAIVSRYTTERFDFAISNPKRSIDECERLAQEFMKFIDDNIPNS